MWGPPERKRKRVGTAPPVVPAEAVEEYEEDGAPGTTENPCALVFAGSAT